MKKYRVTEKHEFIKEDTILERDLIGAVLKKWDHYFSRYEKDTWLEDGWIEEIQEPEFTKEDMIDFYKFAINEKYDFLIDIFENWLKRRNGTK